MPTEFAWLFSTAGVKWVTCILQAMHEIIVAWELVEAFYELLGPE
jgi:hypothetical protein